VTDRNPERARDEARRLAQDVWRRREEYLPELTDLAEAVRRAHDHPEGLTVLSDSADATTSGAPGDSTWVLRELLKYEWRRPAIVTMVAPEVVVAARQLGEGALLATSIGGRRDARFSQPLDIRASVARLFDARFVLSGHLAKNLPVDMGPSVVLKIGAIHIVVTTQSGPHFAPQLFRAAGLDPFAAQVFVAKSPCGFRAAYAPRARAIEVVKAPGCAPSDFWNYEYQNLTRPAWPWDREMTFEA
jgi:microcystin degradation protein MlrC